MITYVKGDIFQSPAQVLVNTVNTVGVMGKGIAKEFKTLFPEMFKKYQSFCESGELDIGKLWVYKTANKWILNFPTKTFWRKPSKMEYIELGLRNFVETYADRGITSIAFPPLGCGNGELDWNNQVRPLMKKYLNPLPIDIFVYFYKKSALDAPEHKDIKKIAEWLQTEPQSLGFDEVYKNLEKIIGSGRSFLNVNTGRNILVNFKKSKGFFGDSKGFVVKLNGKKVILSEEDLLEFWQILRKYGYIMKAICPSNLSNYYDLLISIYSSLPYCSQISIAQNYSSLDNSNSIGLQINPSPKAPSLEDTQEFATVS